MAQVFILQTDSREPYLLASIEKLIVNTKRHQECLEKLGHISGKLCNLSSVDTAKHE